MADTGKRIVWILGAGFSKSLGAPLLNELFSSAQFDWVRECYKDSFKDETLWLAAGIIDLYAAGAHGVDGASPFQRQWEHAEEFLERLDLAVRKRSQGRERLVRFCGAMRNTARYNANQWVEGVEKELGSHEGLERINLIALKLLAAECSVFLDEKSTGYERWKPYLRWKENLDPETDTVITFNYDLLLETMPDSTGARISAALPGQASKSDLDVARGKNEVPALKLHGSVDWCRRGNAISRDPCPPFALLSAKSTTEIAVATPGLNKELAIQTYLKMLWSAAESAIMEADSIVLLGYRLPPTDAYTRQWFLNLIRQTVRQRSSGSNRTPVMRTVLGPTVDGVESQRLKGLIDWAGRGSAGVHVSPVPMWAEDFLDVFERHEL